MFNFLRRLFGEVPDNDQTRKLQRDFKKQLEKTTKEEKIQKSFSSFVEEEVVNLDRQVDLIEQISDLKIREVQLKEENREIKNSLSSFKRDLNQRREDAKKEAELKVRGNPPSVSPSFIKDFFDF